MPRFSDSDCSVTSFRFGRKRRLVLLLAWLTLLPVIGPFPVSSQRRDMGFFLRLVRRPLPGAKYRGRRHWPRPKTGALRLGGIAAGVKGGLASPASIPRPGGQT